MPELTEAAPRLHRVEAVMDRLSLNRNAVFDLVRSGELRSVKVGRIRLISEAALVEYIRRLEAGAGASGAS